jgi:hypothetical protein
MSNAPERIYCRIDAHLTDTGEFLGTCWRDADPLLTEYTPSASIPAMLAEAEQRGREVATNDAADMIGRIAKGYQAGGDGAIACALFLTEGNVRSAAIRARGPAQEGGE